jgi:16S rRNA A1518/A1519 N6-dimethyltransferase RsmA/KsgA/DIM1 with predicted DNA glycosylase/AP lyase activity
LVRCLFFFCLKTIKNNLSNFIAAQNGHYKDHPVQIAAQVLEKSAIDGYSRAENLTLDNFTVLARQTHEYFLKR